MKCTRCGATLLDTDQFCNQCGAKVVRQKRCPDCGTVLRDGTLFCPGCGRKVGEPEEKEPVKGETLDIPIEVIERNILSETAAEMLTDDRKRSTAGKKEAQSIPVKKKPTPQPPARKKKPVYEEPDEEEDWEDDEDFEEEDWEDDEDEEDEGEGPDILTIMTVIIGCVLLVVAVFIGYHFYRQYVPKDYEEAAEELQEEQEEENQAEAGEYAGTLRITSNVNVRTSPSTEGTSVIMVAKQDETYHYYSVSEDGNWYCIDLEGKGGAYDRGYVFADYVTVE